MNVLGSVNLPGGGITFNRELLYTFSEADGWATEVVAADAGFYSGIPGFAFDQAGDPAIAWCFESEGAQSGIRLARRIAAGHWTVEEVNSAVCKTKSRSVELAFDDQGYPAILYLEILEPGTLASPVAPWLVRWSGSGWVEELVNDPLHVTENFRNASLVFDSLRGDFTVVGDVSGNLDVCDRDLSGSWQCERVFDDVGGPYDSGIFGDMNGRYTTLGTDWLGQDPFGELFLAYSTEGDPDVALARRLRGSTDWVQEHVDHPSTRGFDGGSPGQEGPFLAFDQFDRPSLSWAWDGQLYFAWKNTP
jgi:hypothetical protein